MPKTGLTIYYSDGSTQHCKDTKEAEEHITDTVQGCDFAVSVDSIVADDDKDYGCTWTVKVAEE